MAFQWKSGKPSKDFQSEVFVEICIHSGGVGFWNGSPEDTEGPLYSEVV